MSPEVLLLRDVLAPWIFAAGLCVGSFLNVVIARVPEGLSVVRPRSRCPECGTMIAWYDNIPIVSWVLLRGRCRRCKIAIDARYPVVELIGGVLALATLHQSAGLADGLRIYTLACLCVVCAFIDLQWWIIPHVVTWPGIVVGILLSAWSGQPGAVDSLWGALGGFAGFALVGAASRLLMKQEALGQGDWWMLALIGSFLGWKALLPVVFLAAVQGTVVGVAMIARRRLTGGPRPDDGSRAPIPLSDDESPPPPAGAEAGGGGMTSEPSNSMGTTSDSTGAPSTARETDAADEDWTPPPNAVPFGPFLALGALEMLFLGDWLWGLYEGLLLRWLVR